MKIAVVGATGLVGSKMLQVLAERNFPVTELIPVASEKSIGKEITFKGKSYKIQSMQDAIDAKPAIAILVPVVQPLWNGLQNLPPTKHLLLTIQAHGECKKIFLL